jgi:hypothetical protein
MTAGTYQPRIAKRWRVWPSTLMSKAHSVRGRLASKALVKAIRQAIDSGGIDPALLLPDGGLATQANAGKFTGEWTG